MTNNLIGRHVQTHDPERREAQRAERNARQRAYYRTPEGRATAHRAHASEAGLRNRRLGHQKWRATTHGTIANRAHAAVRRAIRRGDLVKQPCMTCGNQQSFAHHANGYEGAAQLDVRWLCMPHHMEAHGRAAA